MFLPFSATESGPGAVTSPASEVVKETDERLPPVPLQEHVFSECSRERILGLLAAMLPPAKPVRETKAVFNVWFHILEKYNIIQLHSCVCPLNMKLQQAVSSGLARVKRH